MGNLAATPRRVFAQALWLAVAAAALVLLVRTWVVLGVVVPMTVSGSSMAPEFRGPHRAAACLDCGKATAVAAEWAPADGRSPCGHCGKGETTPFGSVRGGDRLWVARWGAAERWQTVVLHCPHERSGLCVKRVVGLPGETIELRDGDVFADGDRMTKNLDEQRGLRVPLPAAVTVSPDGGTHTLRPVAGELFTDDLAYNGSLSRRLNPLVDLMVAAEVRLAEHDRLVIEVAAVEWVLDFKESTAQVTVGGEAKNTGPVVVGNRFLIEASTFDRVALLALDGRVVAAAPIGDLGSVAEVSIRVGDKRSTVSSPRLWRDVYYLARPGTGQTAWTLAEGELLLLGDNSAVSVDGRTWGPVSRNLLVGRPLGGF